MKKLYLSFVIFSFLLVIGCQENSIVNPAVPNDEVNANENSSIILKSGSINLGDLLDNPHQVMNSNYLINGTIQYEHSDQIINNNSSASQNTVYINLFVEAEFFNYCTVCNPPTDSVSAGNISSVTNDSINIPTGGQYQLIKTYLINGRNDEMTLNCKFIVTTDTLILSEMWLDLDNTNIFSAYNNLLIGK